MLLFACSESHLSFKGIPIDGNIELFTKRMEKKGFTIFDYPTVEYVRGKEILVEQSYQGSFWSDREFSNAEVSVYATPVTGTVFEVLAVMDYDDFFKDMSVKDFGTYVELLREKYGEPIIKQYSKDYDIEFFDENDSDGKRISLSSAKSLSTDIETMGFFGTRRYSDTFLKPSDDALERFAEEKSGCYIATYETKNGFIRLALYIDLNTWGKDYNEYGLGFVYLDKKNFEKEKMEIDEFIRLKKIQQLNEL